jgi:xanthosine utilization system XapX-like protein
MQSEFQSNRNRELLIAITAIILITVLYAFVVLQLKALPTARGLFGHSIGILGFLLMLMTETLYSLRKRSLIARWGRLSTWLEIHIITGIVGPYMVLLHTSWKFNRLAGVLMLMTIVVVASGFIGRYIYTAIPRTADGAEMESAEIERVIAGVEAEISAVQTFQGENMASTKASKKQLNRLTQRRRILRAQMGSLATARRLMSLWHTIHIPIGMLVFTTAFFHIVAAIYYATLIR